MIFEHYLKNGLLKRQQSNFEQIRKQIIRAEKDLDTYKLVVDQDPEWASTIVYQAMLRAGRALLFSYGYLPTNKQQHKTVVEITGELLSDDFKTIVKQFDKLRRKRNIFFYDSEDPHNYTEAKKALKTARNLLDEIKSLIKKQDPQARFEF